MRSTLVCGLVAVAAVAAASAEEFPLKFKTIPVQEAMNFPGGYGTYGELKLAKPEGLKKEPKAVSRHPLYGKLEGQDSGGILYRLDESKGDGKGYDHLVMDMNQNGDLTDDAVIRRTNPPSNNGSSAPQEMVFGQIVAPGDKLIAGQRPVFAAEVYLYNAELLKSGQGQPDIQIGQLRFKAAWYLEATVEMAGAKHTVGVYDGDSNFRLGDAWRMQTYTSSGSREQNWYFSPGDSLLVDGDRSGKFDNTPRQNESCPLAPILYLGSTPCKVSLAADCRSLKVEPWTDTLAEVALQPRPDQMDSVMLAWEQAKGKWQLIRPTIVDGKIKVPPGDYRLYSCTAVGKGSARDQVLVSGTQRVPKAPLHFTADGANTLKCGGPFDIKVVGTKRKPQPWESTKTDTKSDSDFILSINSNVIGADGEVYSSFLKGEQLNDRPAKPTFTVTDSDGKSIADGNLEYG